ncbi:MAG TPA: hypothetical protein DEP28_11890 [Bacteroidetes bacterium]|nr:hypothetical protein [Bacteroidota bacterium]HCN38297.1 hypothetical protein [Bacteroidota bacterium]
MKKLITFILLVSVISVQDLFSQSVSQTVSGSGGMDMKVYTEWLLVAVFILFALIFGNLIFSKPAELTLPSNEVISIPIAFSGNSIYLSAGISSDLKNLNLLLSSALFMLLIIIVLLLI